MKKKKKFVGRQYSKIEVTDDDLLRIKKGEPEPLDPTILQRTLNGELSFSRFIEGWKKDFTDFLNERGLPTEPFWIYEKYPNKPLWHPVAPQLFPPPDIEDNEISLDRLILHLGYKYDSWPYLAAKGLVLVWEIELALREIPISPILEHALFGYFTTFR